LVDDIKNKSILIPFTKRYFDLIYRSMIFNNLIILKYLNSFILNYF